MYKVLGMTRVARSLRNVFTGIGSKCFSTFRFSGNEVNWPNFNVQSLACSSPQGQRGAPSRSRRASSCRADPGLGSGFPAPGRARPAGRLSWRGRPRTRSCSADARSVSCSRPEGCTRDRRATSEEAPTVPAWPAQPDGPLRKAFPSRLLGNRRPLARPSQAPSTAHGRPRAPEGTPAGPVPRPRAHLPGRLVGPVGSN